MNIQKTPFNKNIYQKINKLTFGNKTVLRIVSYIQIKIWNFSHILSFLILKNTYKEITRYLNQIHYNRLTKANKNRQASFLSLVHANYTFIATLRSLQRCEVSTAICNLRVIIESVIYSVELLNNENVMELSGKKKFKYVLKASKNYPGARQFIKVLSNNLQHIKFGNITHNFERRKYLLCISKNLLPRDNLMIAERRLLLSLALNTAANVLNILSTDPTFKIQVNLINKLNKRADFEMNRALKWFNENNFEVSFIKGEL